MNTSRKTLAGGIGLVLLATAVFAHPKTVLDGEDTEGPLDIAATRHAHRNNDGRTSLRFKLVTYDTWDDRAIAGGKNFAGFEFNLDGDRAIERCAVVDSQDPQERGGSDTAVAYEVRIYQDCNYFDDKLVKSYASNHAGRPDAHSLRVRVPKSVLLGRGGSSYRWRAVTSYQEQDSNSPCAAPEPHGDGGYGTCADFTKWNRHGF